MARRPTSFQQFSYSLAAGAVLRLPLDCDHLVVTELSGEDTLELRLNHGPKGEAFKGLALAGEITHAEFENTGSTTVTLELITAVGLRVTDRRLNLVGGELETDAVSPSTLSSTADDTVAATTTAEVLAENTSRAEAVIKNLDSSNSVRVGDGNVGAARGHQLGPGDSVVLTTTAAISVHNPAAAGVTLSLLETVRS